MSEEGDEPEEDEEDDGDEPAPGGVALLPSSEILEHAVRLTQEYRNDNVTHTVRSLYYKFVGQGIVSKEELAITNAKGKTVGATRFYKRVGRVCSEARYNGQLGMDMLADQGREVRPGRFNRQDLDVERALDTAGDWVRTMHRMLLQTDRWVGQPYFISVWFEKDGLVEALKPVCEELGVSWFPCKGYPSVDALWKWLQLADFACNGSEEDEKFYFGERYGNRLQWTQRKVGGYLATEETLEDPYLQGEELRVGDNVCRQAIVLYFGDADPDGYEIPRSSEKGLRRLMETYGIDVDIEFIRVTLTVEQAQEMNLPPFEAKMTSARYKKYRKEHNTDDAWEIDALDMRVLRQMTRDAIEPYWNQAIYDAVSAAATARSAQLRDRIRDPEWIKGLF